MSSSLAGIDLSGSTAINSHLCEIAKWLAMMNDLVVLKALASEPRLRVLEWLKEPAAHFPPQVDGDFEADGVCADYIREKLGIAAATASRHLTLLTDAQLLIATRKKGWVFYRRNEVALTQFAKNLEEL